MIAFFWIVILPVLAQTGPDTMQIEIHVDDRESMRLASPSVEVVGAEEEHPLVDDGSWSGDEGADGIWSVELEIARSDTLVLRIRDEGVLLEELTHHLPNTPNATYRYRTQTGDVPLVELSAEVPHVAPAEPDRSPEPVEAVATPETGDSIDLVFVVDDRALNRLIEPVLQVDQVDVPRVAIRDDGTVIGDLAGDGIWMAELTVRRSETIIVNLLDQNAQVGQIQAFLPSSDEAEIRVMTTQEGGGLELVNEATSGGEVGGPSGSMDGSGGGRLAHVLWVLIALFAVLFTYLRSVVWRTWTQDVRPRLVEGTASLSSDEPDE